MTNKYEYEQDEPFGWYDGIGFSTNKNDFGKAISTATPLYTHPAPSCQECENLKHDLEGYMDANKELINREWQGLSDDEIIKLWSKYIDADEGGMITDFARAIEQALKEKNNAAS